MNLALAIVLSLSTANAANVAGTLGCAERALGLYVPDHANVLEDYQCEGGGSSTMSSSEVIYQLDVGEMPVTVRIANGTFTADLPITFIEGHSILILKADCDASACLGAVGGSPNHPNLFRPSSADPSITFTPEAGVTYYAVVESEPGWAEESQTFDLVVDCLPEPNAFDDNSDLYGSTSEPGCGGGAAWLVLFPLGLFRRRKA